MPGLAFSLIEIALRVRPVIRLLLIEGGNALLLESGGRLLMEI